MGLLVVTVIEGKTLEAKDIAGTSDPFVTLKIVSNESGETLAKGKTKVLRKTLNPQWNESISLPLDEPKGHSLALFVYDWNRIGRKENLGKATFPLEELKHSQGRDLWLPLGGVHTGSIHIRLSHKTDNRARILVSYKNDPVIEYELLREVKLSPQIGILCQLAGAEGSPDTYTLQLKDSESVLTEENLRDLKFKLPYDSQMRLIIKPNLKVKEILQNLTDGSPEVKKRAIFGLKSHLQDPSFAQAFISLNGIEAITNTIVDGTGNTLAYALQALDACMNYGVGWDQLGPKMVDKIVAFMDSNNLNVKGGALKIAVHLASSKNHGYPAIESAISSMDANAKPSESIYAKLIESLKTTDVYIQLSSLTFLNAMLCSAPEKHFDKLKDILAQNSLTKVLKEQMGSADAELKEEITKHLKIKHQLHREPIPYQKESEEHEALLLSLWSAIFPNTPLTQRVSPQWKSMGFQGNDPATDFRGMGVLALRHLLYFSQRYTKTLSIIMERHSENNPNYYPVAVAGINISKLIFDIFRNLNTEKELRLLFEHEHAIEEIYCYVLQYFDRTWDETKSSYFDFSAVMSSLTEQLVEKLPQYSTLDQLRKDTQTSKITMPEKKDKKDNKKHTPFFGAKKAGRDEKKDKELTEEFFAGVRSGDTKKVNNKIKEGANINELDPSGYSALHLAVMDGNVDMVRLLLWKDAMVDKKNSAGWTALLEASKSSTPEICELLLDKGADPNAETEDGVSSLHYLVSRKFDDFDACQEVLNTMLAKGVNVNINKNSNSETPLHYAVTKGLVDPTRFLLVNGADINAKNKRGYTALHIAILLSQSELVELLLEYGADTTIAANKEGTCEEMAKRVSPQLAQLFAKHLNKTSPQAIPGSPTHLVFRRPLPSTPPRRSSAPLVVDEANKLPYFHGNITREDAEKLVCAQKVSSFLLRSSSVRSCYAMTVYSQTTNETTHYLIFPRSAGGYSIQDSEDEGTYKTVKELVERSPTLKGFVAVNRDVTYQVEEVTKQMKHMERLLGEALEQLKENDPKWVSTRAKLKLAISRLNNEL